MWMHVLHGEKTPSMTQRFTSQHKQKPALADSFLYCEIKKKKKLQVVGDTSPDLESSATF